MKLSNKLIFLTTLLLIAGIVITDLTTYFALSSFYQNKTLNDLDITKNQIYSFLVGNYLRGHPIGFIDEARLENEVNPDVFVTVIGPNHQALLTIPAGGDPPPKIPAKVPLSQPPTVPYFRDRFLKNSNPTPKTIEVSAQGKPQTHYLLEAVGVPQGILVVAEDLASQQSALAHLRAIEIVTTIAVCIIFISLSLAIITRGLKPLNKMADTAIEIASGNLEKRVDEVSPKTEVGRLGMALNVMLSQLIAALQEKVRSEKRLRDFVADASHELRTPLTSIKGYAELVKRDLDNLPEPHRTAVLRINAEADRLGVIVDELLLLERLDSGRELDTSEVDLTSVITEVAADFSVASSEYNLSLSIEENVCLLGDEYRLRQAIGNLFKNIQDHVEPPANVEVSLNYNDSVAYIRIKDSGKGIEKSEQDRVFERFYRGGDAPKGGSGLGLPIVKAILSAHNAQITLNSEPGKFTEFLISFPGAYKKVKQYESST